MQSADITDQQAAGGGLRKAYEREHATVARLTQLDEDGFLAILSHELRTPLTSIAGYLEILADGDTGPLSSVQQQMLDTMARNVSRLRTLVEDLVIVDSLRAGALEFSLAPTPLPEVIRRAVEAATPLAHQRDQRIELCVAPGMDPVPADAAQLGRAVAALLSNALKFSPAGTPVTVTIAGSGPYAAIEVIDRGEGVLPGDLERIFEPYYRTAAANRQAVQGVGLGLSIARDIVAAHRGRIAVASVPGAGSTFTIYLPVAADAR